MTTPSREEFDLQFRWIDDKWQGYLKILDARFEAQAAQWAEWRTCEHRLFAMRHADMKAALDEYKAESAAGRAESKQDARSVKIVTVTTAIASVMAIAAFNATVLSNMVASFESGKGTAPAISSSAEQLARLQSDVTKSQQRIDALIERFPASEDSMLERAKP